MLVYLLGDAPVVDSRVMRESVWIRIRNNCVSDVYVDGQN